jgi:hypothetical protein
MPRQKKRPSIDSQLRTLIATATEEKNYPLAQRLITLLRDYESPLGVITIPEGTISVGITKEDKA